jgi:hypothetical protein
MREGKGGGGERRQGREEGQGSDEAAESILESIFDLPSTIPELRRVWHLTRGFPTLHPTCHPRVLLIYRISITMFTKPVTALLGMLALCLTMALAASKSSEQLQIGVKYKPDDCPLKTRNGDKLSMQYVVLFTS